MEIVVQVELLYMVRFVTIKTVRNFDYQGTSDWPTERSAVLTKLTKRLSHVENQ
jgi:hypothetical protein